MLVTHLTRRFVCSCAPLYQSVGLWSGNAAACIRLFPHNSIKFGVFETLKTRLDLSGDMDDLARSSSLLVASGAAAGFVFIYTVFLFYYDTPNRAHLWRFASPLPNRCRQTSALLEPLRNTISYYLGHLRQRSRTHWI